MKVQYTAEARENITAIGEWIARDNPARAVTFLVELRAACEDLATFPEAFPVIEHNRVPPARKRVHGSYLIIYEVTDIITILTVRHGAREAAQLSR